MMSIVRSLIREEGKEEKQIKNLEFFISEAKEKFIVEEANKIFEFIEKFYLEYSEVPGFSVLENQFKGDQTVIEFLDSLKSEKIVVDADFKDLVKKFKEEKERAHLQGVLRKEALALDRDSSDSAVRKVAKSVIKSCLTVWDEIDSRKEFRTKGSVSSKEEVEEFLVAYKEKARKGGSYGVLGGFEEIDLSLRGFKQGELILVAGWSGDGKSTFCMNYAYNTAVMLGGNVLYFTLEMSYDQIRRCFYTTHCANYAKWRREALKSDDLRDGTLSKPDEEFLKRATDDLYTNKDYGKIILYQPELETTLDDIRIVAETENVRNKLHLIVIDYIGLLDFSSRRVSDLELNYVIRGLKRMAIAFDKGRGIPIMSPYQVSRMANRKAHKNDGIYGLDCLSNTPEAERSADVVLSIYTNEFLRDQKQVKVGCLKNRDGALFKPLFMFADFATKKMAADVS